MDGPAIPTARAAAADRASTLRIEFLPMSGGLGVAALVMSGIRRMWFVSFSGTVFRYPESLR
jgi:hypothetical protein